jgi:hypothetical protein
MPEPLKNMLSEELIASLSKELKLVYETFDSEAFQESVLVNSGSKKN